MHQMSMFFFLNILVVRKLASSSSWGHRRVGFPLFCPVVCLFFFHLVVYPRLFCLVAWVTHFTFKENCVVHLELRKAGDDSSWCSIVQGAQIFVGPFSSPSLIWRNWIRLLEFCIIFRFVTWIWVSCWFSSLGDLLYWEEVMSTYGFVFMAIIRSRLYHS